MKNFQRDEGAGTIVGMAFENCVKKEFDKNDSALNLQKQFKVELGITKRKEHAFDFGNDKIIIECKSHRWTESDRVPSGKMRNWNEAMYLFYLVSKNYKKFFIVEKNFSQKRKETLLEYYIRSYGHLIPQDVILVDFDIESKKVEIYWYDDASKDFTHKSFENLKEYLQKCLK